ncbi:hypothetical protein BT69DRAFT_1339806 [Atractiella rhizophila]|nr:hypothetical protein BT69DRAFT_1339806 [Atractiella rhizophila]
MDCPSPHTSARPRLLNTPDINFLMSVIRTDPSLYLDELQDCLEDQRYRRAIQRNEVLRDNHILEMMMYARELFVWLDESGFDDNDSRRDWGYGAQGCKLIYLPPHSSDLNPIKELFACIKKWLKRWHRDTLNLVDKEDIIMDACDAVNAELVGGWITDSFYS